MLVDLSLNVSINTKNLLTIFFVIILTPIDEDNVPLNVGLNGLTQTKCTSFTFAPRAMKLRCPISCKVVLLLPLLKP
jgi:hypothetical protein